MGASVEASGRTVEEAVEQALHQLGLSADDVEIDVVSEGRRGRFGIGGEEARVVVRAREGVGVSAPARPADDADDAAAAVTEATGDGGKPRRTRRPRETRPAHDPRPVDDEAVDRAEEILRDLLRLMDVDGSVSRRAPETPGDGLGQASAVLDVRGDDLGVLIGRRGETLAALQYVVNVLANRGIETGFSVSIDVEGYRRRREEALHELAARSASRALSGGRPVLLDPMPANERRIVHLALADDERVVTSSTGGGEQRRVVIEPRRP